MNRELRRAQLLRRFNDAEHKPKQIAGREVIIPSGGDMLLGEDRVVVITGRDKSVGGLEEIFRGGVQ